MKIFLIKYESFPLLRWQQCNWHWRRFKKFIKWS